MKPWRITIHCSDSPNGRTFSAATIRKIHIEEKGFSDIGYHLVIQPDGEVERGRGLNELGAHVKGANEGNIGICLIGEGKYTQAQWNRLREQLDALVLIYDIKPWELRCHYEYDSAREQGKTCPNVSINIVMAWWLGHHEDALTNNLLRPV